MNIPSVKQYTKTQVIENCWKFVIQYLLDNKQSELQKSEFVKSLFKLKLNIKQLQLTVKYGNIVKTHLYSFKYSREEYSELPRWRKDVFKRDNWACKECGGKVNIEAHHIKSWKDYPDLRFELDNGLTLCRKCHSKTNNYGRKYNAIC